MLCRFLTGSLYAFGFKNMQKGLKWPIKLHLRIQYDLKMLCFFQNQWKWYRQKAYARWCFSTFFIISAKVFGPKFFNLQSACASITVTRSFVYIHFNGNKKQKLAIHFLKYSSPAVCWEASKEYIKADQRLWFAQERGGEVQRPKALVSYY
jgi:hypothetical protein